MTNPSTSWNTVTVSGTYRHIDASAKAGTVTFTIPNRVVAVTDSIVFPSGGVLTVTLDGTGSFTLGLPATDDADISPVGWQYIVTESFTDGGSNTYLLSVPLASGSINVSSIRGS